ncbi:MAG: sigma-54 dependent transcriptional regulator [Elusimicrobiales bacterium]|jgi:DNA-binding NtrC family response regulator|nr:sigma-54 dependent transcriptional regulator [Elusimicrobiales bacterium]
MSNFLVIEDDADARKALKAVLGSRKHTLQEASGGEEGLRMAESAALDAVLLDLVLGDMDGLTVLEKLKTDDPSLPVIILTGHADVHSAVRAMKLGAADYLVKPFTNEELLLVAERAAKDRRFHRELEALRSHVAGFHGANVFVGESAAVKAVEKLVSQVAGSELTVILTGPSGSGKEVWARRIHALSGRRNNPFVALDCGALPENLVESELFGYERGAFTGADRPRAGLFETAYGGTLFLDEVSNLEVPTQAKLLRVLQERRIRRLGGKKDIPVDVRIITATNRDLQSCIKAGSFREDLYHRLNQFAITLPSLRERAADIRPLAMYFLKEANAGLKKNVSGLDTGALAALDAYAWPGNIRELKNIITRAVLMAEGEVSSSHLGFGEAVAAPVSPACGGEIKDFDLKKAAKEAASVVEKRLIAAALEASGGNKVKAAKLMGIDRKALYNKLEEYNINM